MSGITIAIPTYNRGTILAETIERLLVLEPKADEIVIVDQTPADPPEIAAKLEAWSRGGKIRWERLEKPSVPAAMNHALRVARQPIVLFLDDDLIPEPSLAGEHLRAHGDGIWAVAGQVLQPGEETRHFEESRLHRGALRDLEFPFSHDVGMDIENVMAGNLSVVRERALSIGGFAPGLPQSPHRLHSP